MLVVSMSSGPEGSFDMTFFRAFKEFAYGLKTGASYSVSSRNNFVEKVTTPKVHLHTPGH